MPHHDTTSLAGMIQHVFSHRFTLEVKGETYLADLGPKGAEIFPLAAGLHVSLKGERRPSEIKVTQIEAHGSAPVNIHHKKPHHAPDHVRPNIAADPLKVLAAVAAEGWSSVDEPHRKPKHFEVLARQGKGAWTELHVDFGGNIYKQKVADPAKWPTAA